MNVPEEKLDPGIHPAPAMTLPTKTVGSAATLTTDQVANSCRQDGSLHTDRNIFGTGWPNALPLEVGLSSWSWPKKPDTGQSFLYG